MKNTPFISLLLPIHNQELYLYDCLKNILKQSHKEIEIIVIDDFSKDQSVSVVKSMKKIDPRIKFYRNVKHYGQAISFNRAIKKAKGNFITFVKATDKMHKDKLKKQLRFLLENPKIVAVGTQHAIIDGRNRKLSKTNFPTNSGEIYAKPLQGVSMLFEGLMINRLRLPKDVLKFEQKPETLMYSDMLMKLLSYGEVTNLSECLHYHRTIDTPFSVSLQKRVNSLIKLWFSTTDYDYQPSLRSFLSLLRKPTVIFS